jgi:hypothetical protein
MVSKYTTKVRAGFYAWVQTQLKPVGELINPKAMDLIAQTSCF